MTAADDPTQSRYQSLNAVNSPKIPSIVPPPFSLTTQPLPPRHMVHPTGHSRPFQAQ